MRIFREVNQTVNVLAKHGLKLDLHLNVLHVVPDFLSHTLQVIMREFLFLGFPNLAKVC